MFLRCCVIILCLYYVNTSGESNFKSRNNDFINEFSFWPSIHNGARTLRNRRAAQNQDVSNTVAVGQMEGMVGFQSSQPASNDTLAPVTNAKPDSPAVHVHSVEHSTAIENKDKEQTINAVVASGTDVKVTGTTAINASAVAESTTKVTTSNATINSTQKPIETVQNGTEVKNNLTMTDNTTVKKDIDFNSPGVVKRGAIVFGGFALLAAAYFVFYRTKQKNNEANNMHSSIDANQFRYGVLQSEDRRDNMESSRIPLTMESDDDDDDDMEIFDLGEKKKSLSYVNLQLNDEDVVLGLSPDSNDRDNLLLDIEDGNDTLINWSSSGSKSVL